MVPPKNEWVNSQLVQDTVASGLVSYGKSVALQGNLLLIGDPDWTNAGGIPRGRVHAFGRVSPAEPFAFLERFSAPIGGPLEIGNEIVLRGEEAVISAPGSTLLNPLPSLFVYRFDALASEWNHTQTLQAPVGTVPTALGSGGLDLVGDLMAIGDPIAPILPVGGAVKSGVCYLFRRDAITLQWSHEEILIPPDPQVDARFGLPAVISPTRVAVLAELEADVPGGVQGGRVHIFEKDGAGVWSVIQTLRADDVLPAGAERRFSTLAVEGDLLVVGQPDYDLPNGVGQGRVLVYREDVSGTWVVQDPLDRGVFGLPGDLVGAQLDVDSNRVVVAAPGAFASGGTLGTLSAVDLTPSDCDGNLVQDSCDLVSGLALDRNSDEILDACQNIGVPYCLPGVPNSSGQVAGLAGLVSAEIGVGLMQVCGENLPHGEFGYLLASPGQDFFSMPGNSAGNLCLALGADFGRYNTQVIISDITGVACTMVDFSTVPTGAGVAVLAPGDVWNFQFWFRDGSVSNFTTAIEVSVP